MSKRFKKLKFPIIYFISILLSGEIIVFWLFQDIKIRPILDTDSLLVVIITSLLVSGFLGLLSTIVFSTIFLGNGEKFHRSKIIATIILSVVTLWFIYAMLRFVFTPLCCSVVS